MTWDVLNAMKTPEYNMNIGGPLRRIIMMIFPYNLRTIFSHDSLGPNEGLYGTGISDIAESFL